MGRHSQTLLIVAVVAVSGALAARPALAQSKLTKARKRFEQGEAYFKAGTYDKAIEEYRAAYDLVPRPGLLFNIGLCYENLDDPENAIAFYDRYVGADPDGGKVSEARARREALSRKLDERRADAERRQRAEDERTAGTRALIAGDYDEAIARLTASYELVPEPEVLFELAEAYRGVGDWILAATEYRRYLAASETGANRARASERLREVEAKAAADRVGPGQATGPARTRRVRRGSLTPAIAAYAVAGVAAGAGVLYGLSSRSTLSDIEDELVTGTPPLDTGDPRFDDGRTAARNANIAYAVAGVAAITGAVLTWRALRTKEVIIAPTASASGAGVTMELTW